MPRAAEPSTVSAPDRPPAPEPEASGKLTPDRAPAPEPEASGRAAPDRAAYAASQAALLDALLRGDGYPEGFVAAKADAAGTSLRRKRGRAVARAWPALAIDLGGAFDERFDAYARGADAPASGDPLADGLAFARSLPRDAPLSDNVRVELLLARAALRRRGMFLRAARLHTPYPRLLVVARLPLLGARHRSYARRRLSG
jgi:hypothetical protein